MVIYSLSTHVTINSQTNSIYIFTDDTDFIVIMATKLTFSLKTSQCLLTSGFCIQWVKSTFTFVSNDFVLGLDVYNLQL